MTTLPVSALPRASATLRLLSGYERLFLAIDIVNGFNFAIAVTFSGVIAHSRWQAAFAQLQKRHPLLNAAVNVDDWHAPAFERVAGDPIPLTFLRRASATDWQRVMESEIAEPFNLSVAPLLRAAIVEDDAGCDLVITANHVIADGISVLALVAELLRVLAGHTFEVLPLPQSAEARVAAIVASEPGLALDAAVIDEFTPTPTPRAFTPRNRKGKNTISALRLSPAQSTLLLERSRQNQTTVSAVLLAALAFAVRRLSPDQSGSDLQWSTPVNTIWAMRATSPCRSSPLEASIRTQATIYSRRRERSNRISRSSRTFGQSRPHSPVWTQSTPINSMRRRSSRRWFRMRGTI
jgi:hypothetical protein